MHLTSTLIRENDMATHKITTEDLRAIKTRVSKEKNYETTGVLEGSRFTWVPADLPQVAGKVMDQLPKKCRNVTDRTLLSVDQGVLGCVAGSR